MITLKLDLLLRTEMGKRDIQECTGRGTGCRPSLIIDMCMWWRLVVMRSLNLRLLLLLLLLRKILQRRKRRLTSSSSSRERRRSAGRRRMNINGHL